MMNNMLAKKDEIILSLNEYIPVYDRYILNTLKYTLTCSTPSLSANEFTISAYPNPYTSSSIITYHLSENGIVSLQLTSLLTGKKITDLITNKSMESGDHQLPIGELALESGIYILKLSIQTKEGEIIQKNIKLIRQ